MEFVLAYIDAGSGSLILQAVIAAVIAVPFFLRSQIARAGRALSTVTRRNRPEPTPIDDGAGR
jgi:hypothetical protein